MGGTKTILSIIALVLFGITFASNFSLKHTVEAQAQVHAPMARAAAECVTYGSGSALQMCFHTFADGTKCVATGGGGLASAGAGAALQCSFR